MAHIVRILPFTLKEGMTGGHVGTACVTNCGRHTYKRGRRYSYIALLNHMHFIFELIGIRGHLSPTFKGYLWEKGFKFTFFKYCFTELWNVRNSRKVVRICPERRIRRTLMVGLYNIRGRICPVNHGNSEINFRYIFDVTSTQTTARQQVSLARCRQANHVNAATLTRMDGYLTCPLFFPEKVPRHGSSVRSRSCSASSIQLGLVQPRCHWLEVMAISMESTATADMAQRLVGATTYVSLTIPIEAAVATPGWVTPTSAHAIKQTTPSWAEARIFMWTNMKCLVAMQRAHNSVLSQHELWPDNYNEDSRISRPQSVSPLSPWACVIFSQ